MTFPENTFWCAIPQNYEVNFECNKFNKSTACNLQTRIPLQKKSHGQDDKITGQLYLSKSIPNVRFNLSCQDILYYVKIKPDLNR